MANVTLLKSHSSGGAVQAEIEVEGHKLHVVFHTERVVANGWEPYDQPDPAAYIPYGRNKVHRIDGAGGALMISVETVAPRTP